MNLSENFISCTMHILVWLLLSNRKAAGYTTCGQKLFTESRGKISLKLNEQGTIDCRYYIVTRDSELIKLKFTKQLRIDDDMPACRENFLEIHTGCGSNKTRIGRYCTRNRSQPPIIYTHHNCMELHVTIARPSTEKTRISVQYVAAEEEQAKMKEQQCERNTTIDLVASGYIQSPHWPSSQIQSSQICTWVLHMQHERTVQYTLVDLDLADKDEEGSCQSYLQMTRYAVTDQEVVILPKTCYLSAPIVFTTSYKSVILELKQVWHKNKTARGFLLMYTSYTQTEDDSISTPLWQDEVFGITFTGTMITILLLTGMIHCMCRKPRRR